MDIYKAILELKAERSRIDRAIAALEHKGKVEGAPKRGRRSWNADARRAAAERMKKYWEQRRRKAAVSEPYNGNPPSTESA
jgi:hypothetical protein